MAEVFDAYQGHDPIEICKEYVDNVLKVLFPHADADVLSSFGGAIEYPSYECKFDFPLWQLLGNASPYSVSNVPLFYFTNQEHLAEILNSNSIRLPNLSKAVGEAENQEIQSYLDNMYVLSCYGIAKKEDAEQYRKISNEKGGIALELEIETSQYQQNDYLFGAVNYRANFPALLAEYAAKKQAFETKHAIKINDCAIQALLSQFQKNDSCRHENEARLVYLPHELVSPFDNRTLFYSIDDNRTVIYHKLALNNIYSKGKEAIPTVRIRNIHIASTDFETTRDSIEMLLYANRTFFDVANIDILPV